MSKKIGGDENIKLYFKNTNKITFNGSSRGILYSFGGNTYSCMLLYVTSGGDVNVREIIKGNGFTYTTDLNTITLSYSIDIGIILFAGAGINLL